MKEGFKVFFRFFPNLKGYMIFNFVFNILGALFGVFSFIALIPLLRIIFNTEVGVYEAQAIDFSLIPLKIPRDAMMNNLYFYMGEFIKEHSKETALIAVGGLSVGMIFLKNLFSFGGAWTMVKILNHVVKNLRSSLYEKILSLPIGYFNEERKGDIISRTTNDVKEIESAIQSSMDILFRNPIIILFTLIAMIFTSWQLTIFVLIMLPIAGAIIGYIGKSLRAKSLEGQTMVGQILSTIEETLGGLRIVKGFTAEDKMYTKQDGENEKYRKIMDGLMIRNSLASPLSEVLGVTVIMVIMWYGGTLIIGGDSALSPEEFIVYLGLFYNIINPAKGFSTSYYRIQKGLASIDRVDEVLNAESNVVVSDKPIPLDNFKSNISYEKVWFKYQEDFVLQEINLDIKKGQSIALVGQSGSGKSTMIDLIPRFYDVVEGSIKVDGVDVKDVEPKALRSLLGIVNQEPVLFNDTIYNNIAFSKDNASKEEVERAAEIANAHEFILETENGYNTMVGDRGGRLSGGQRQRISIARAILKNPPIMILDEATSSLDTESERLVQDAIDKLMKDRTSIVIAHRLSTIKNVDVIYVMRNGVIRESGSFNELIQKDGEFKKLHDIQFS